MRPRRRSGDSLLTSRREEILDAAAKLFAKHGYTDTDTQPRVVAVWAKVDDFEPESIDVFTGDNYADWHETNYLSGIA